MINVSRIICLTAGALLAAHAHGSYFSEQETLTPHQTFIVACCVAVGCGIFGYVQYTKQRDRARLIRAIAATHAQLEQYHATRRQPAVAKRHPSVPLYASTYAGDIHKLFHSNRSIDLRRKPRVTVK